MNKAIVLKNLIGIFLVSTCLSGSVVQAQKGTRKGPNAVTLVSTSTITVQNGGDSAGVCPGPTCTLRQAILLANSTPADDTIDFQIPAADTCNVGGVCTIALTTGELSIKDATTSGKLTITNAGGPTKLAISGGNAGRVFCFEFRSDSVLDGVMVKSGNGVETNNPNHIPGTNNHGGGILMEIANLSITNSIVSGNTASVQGGGIYNYFGNLQLTNTAIVANMTDTTVLSNPSIRGGGLYTFDGTVIATNSTINGNAAKVGGGIFNDGSVVTLTNSSINSNIATTSDPNEIAEAGGIYGNFGTTTVTGSSISGNSAAVGGGYSGVGGTLSVTDSAISGNTVAGDGGGIQIHGGPDPTSTSVTVTGSTLSGNNVTQFGNGSALVATTPGTVVNILNSTISGNGGSGAEGAIVTKATATIASSTITDNFSDNSAAVIAFVNSSVTVKNAIVAGNRSRLNTCTDVGGSFVSQGNNAIGIAANSVGPCQTGFTTGQNNDQLGTSLSPLDARLAPLGYYGGRTQTHALLINSPALDAGNAAGAPATDQRGAGRVASVDIGSFELNNSANGGTYTAVLPAGSTSQPYSQTITANNVINGVTYVYTISSGSLPPGLSLTASNSPSGSATESSFAPESVIAIAGTPTAPGLFTFTIAATGNGSTTETRYSINIIGGQCVGAPSNIAAWYPGEGNANDYTGHHNTGTPTGQGSVTYAAGKVGEAFQFNNAIVTVPDSNSLDATTGLTIDGWVAPTQPGGDNGASSFVFKGDLASSTNQSYGLLFLNTRQFSLRLGNASGITGLNSVTALPLNVYTHIAATYDGSSMCIYVNGALDGPCQSTPLGTLGNTSVPLTFGSFAGALDELQIFTRALSLNEIKDIYNAASSGVCRTTTASGVSISGRVLSNEGRAVRAASVILTDSRGVARTVQIGSQGVYRFDDVRSGETYVLSVRSGRFEFTPRAIGVTDDLTDVDLLAY